MGKHTELRQYLGSNLPFPLILESPLKYTKSVAISPNHFSFSKGFTALVTKLLVLIKQVINARKS